MNNLLSIVLLLLLTSAGIAQDLPCKAGPKTIRAVTVATSSNVCLSWPTNQYRLIIRVDRRIYTNRPAYWQNWVNLYSVTNGSSADGQYCDTTVGSGTNYEYRVSQLITNYTCSDPETRYPFWYYQHICTGTGVPLRDARGNLVLLVESGVAASLATELSTLTNDLVGDGYKVFRHDVAAVEVTNSPIVTWSQAVTNTKNLVITDYNTDPTADWTLFIVGHVPVPYAGLSSPGGHTGNYGAHPADWYYADTNITAWTDTTANDSTGDFAAQHNVPGDGKFDQSVLPTAPEMRVGRIDLRNMPAFVGKSETDLLRQYLNRDHQWRSKQFTVRDMGIINSNNNGGLIYRALPPDAWDIQAGLFGSTNNIVLGDWLRDASSTNNSYLLAASYGNGEYDRDLQVGYTTNFASTNLYAAFITHFGSYFGDWDSTIITNCVLQAGLASGGYALASYYHSEIMDIGSSAIGEPIGQELYAEEQTAFIGSLSNNYISYGVYDTNTGTTSYNGVLSHLYISLLGDPTLKQRIVAPPTNAFVQKDGADRLVYWTASTDTNIKGYHVYRAPTTNLNMVTRLTTPPTNSPYRDVSPPTGTNYTWWVRAVKLDQSSSRSFYNASEAAFSGATLHTNYYVATNGLDANPGTSAQPFLTVQKGVNVAQAGDIVYATQGTYGEAVLSAHDGSAGLPITIDGQGVATLWSFASIGNQYQTFQNWTLAGKASGYWMQLNKGSHFCVVSNNVFDGGYNPSLFYLLAWENPSGADLPFGATCASNCLVISNTFEHAISEGSGVRMFGANNLFYGNVCRDYDNADWLYLWGVSNRIVGNLFTNIFAGSGTGHPDCIQSFGGNGVGASGILVESNVFINCPGDAQICMFEGQDCANCFTNWTIRNNLFVRIGNATGSVMPNINWYNNTFIECATNAAGAAYVFIFGSGTNGVTYTNYAADTANGCSVLNNVFYNCGTGNTNKGYYNFYTYLTNVQADYNFGCVTNYGAMAVDGSHRAVGAPGGWDGGPSQSSWWEPHGINGGNPSLGANYHPLTNSILIGAATNLNAFFLTDAAGVTRGSAWDIGAYQFQAGTNAPVAGGTFSAGTIRAGRVSKP